MDTHSLSDTTLSQLLAMVQRQARRWYLRHGARWPLSDYESAALEALAYCLAHRDPQQPLASYVAVRVRGALQDLARSHIGRGGWRPHAVSLDDHTSHLHAETRSPEAALTLGPLLASLAGAERRQLLRYLAEGWTVAELARASGVTAATTARQLSATLARLRHRLLQQHFRQGRYAARRRPPSYPPAHR